ncbi:MAG: HD domain-containing protein [Oligoflexia bacterium]|nr:HD domain-containing protein [Oligoflexia bacterium]MBF0366662.1 HD domain-containing protein [Oligoflexia bacterium]
MAITNDPSMLLPGEENPTQQQSEFVRISIAIILQVNEKVPFDIYIERSEGIFTKLFHKNNPIDQEMLLRYQNEKHVTALYVHNLEHKTYRYYVEKILELALSDPRNTPHDKLTAAVSEVASLAMAEIYLSTEVSKKILDWAGKSVNGCIALLGQNPKSLAKVLESLKAHPAMLKHSVTTCIFSMVIIKQIGYDSDRTLMLLGLGALLHDIGMSLLPNDWEFKPDLTPDQWRQIKEHPQLGHRMLEDLNFVKTEVRTIVLQHHEQPNGMGYPNNFFNKDIYYLAKIVSIADSFSEKILPREYRPAPMTALQALASMREETGRFDDEIFKHFEKLFWTAKTKRI